MTRPPMVVVWKNILLMSTLLSDLEIPHRMPRTFCIEGKKILKFTWKTPSFQKSKVFLSKMEKTAIL